jgi:hypothetical protein
MDISLFQSHHEWLELRESLAIHHARAVSSKWATLRRPAREF